MIVIFILVGILIAWKWGKSSGKELWVACLAMLAGFVAVFVFYDSSMPTDLVSPGLSVAAWLMQGTVMIGTFLLTRLFLLTH